MTQLTVASWNIRKCIGLDRRRDPHRTARVIAGFQADIVVLQEADKRLGRRPAALTPEIVESETGLVAADAGGHEPSIGWHGNAVLLADRVAVEDRHNLHLPGIEPRGALVLDLLTDGMALRLVATHLGFLRRYRRSQLATIRSRLEAMTPLPTIILGDFNEWSDRRGLEPLGRFEIHAPGPTFHAARPVAALDRIAVSREVEVRDAGVLSAKTAERASDHLPVWARVSL